MPNVRASVGQSRRLERSDWPLAASTQQSERMRRIGVLMNLTADDPEGQARLAAFLQGLQELGWTDGRNVRIAPYLAAAARSGLSLVWKIVLIGELLGRGVVRERLKLKLGSKKVDGIRVYNIAGVESSKHRPRKSERQSS